MAVEGREPLVLACREASGASVPPLHVAMEGEEGDAAVSPAVNALSAYGVANVCIGGVENRAVADDSVGAPAVGDLASGAELSLPSLDTAEASDRSPSELSMDSASCTARAAEPWSDAMRDK